jgi:hypothetical protein
MVGETAPLFKGETAPLFNAAFGGVKLIGMMALTLLLCLLLKLVLRRFKPMVRFYVIGVVLVICVGYLLLHKMGGM